MINENSVTNQILIPQIHIQEINQQIEMMKTSVLKIDYALLLDKNPIVEFTKDLYVVTSNIDDINSENEI